MKIVVNDRYAALRPFVEEIARHGIPADAREVYRARNRVVACRVGDIELNIKAFRRPSFPNNFVYTTLRRSKARRSMENALRLQSMGFNTPDPVAYIEVKKGGQLRESYYISLQINADGDFRRWLEHPDAMAALPDLADEMVRLHRAGVFHKDFSPGNILFKRRADGHHDFYLIDLNRMRFGVKSQRTLLRNLSVVYVESADETARLARLYARAASLDPHSTEQAARRMLQRYLTHKRRLRAIKHPFRRT